MHATKLDDKIVAIVGLGYVGLPLALAFGRKIRTIGFDISQEKIHSYVGGVDPTREQSESVFKAATKLEFTSNPASLKEADFVIVAVPTPVDQAKTPDLEPCIRASQTVGENLKAGAVIVFESTVYPGVTEDVCGPLIEKYSGKKRGLDFKLGYSPERINPGDHEHTLEKIIKVVSGEDDETLDAVASLYSLVVSAGVFKATSIKVAEAAKVIENTQRDLNIALMNELSIIFNKLQIDTSEVLAAARTKWNFMPFRPGLVGGHCIGVDPYYLTYKAEMLGYHPQVILAGRRINDSMGKYVAEQTVKKMMRGSRPLKNASVLVMGLTFKENCSDLRNSKVIDVVHEFQSYGIQTQVWDPVADPAEAQAEYGIQLTEISTLKNLDAIVAAVPHKQVLEVNLNDLRERSFPQAPFTDVKAAFNPVQLEKLGFAVWRL